MSDTIKCPACGEVVEADQENCPFCGAPISVLAGNDISGAPIDNKAAIDAMLRSASMLMNESEALGIGSLDDPDDEEYDEDEEEEGAAEITAEAPKQNAPAELSAEQKSSMEAGGVINLSPDSMPAPPKPAPSAPQPTAPAPSQAQNAAATPLEDEVLKNFRELQAKSENAAPPEKPPKPPKPHKKSSETVIYELDEDGNPIIDDKPKKEKKKKKEAAPKENKRRSPVKSLIMVVIALAVGICAGFIGKMFVFPDFPEPSCQEFAAKSVDVVVQKTAANKQLYVAEAYVKEGTYAVQCIFRALVESQDTVESKWYRVKVDNDDKKTTNIYLELDPDVYDRLRNSDDSEERAQAAVLKSNQNELERCINEVREGQGWDAANVTLINNSLHPYVPPAAETESETETDTEE